MRGLISLSSEVTGTAIQDKTLGGPGFLICRTALIAWGRLSRLVLPPKQLLYTYFNTNSGRNLNVSSSDKYL
jgi:hypothetical protein